jgi:hypothetical protein
LYKTKCRLEHNVGKLVQKGRGEGGGERGGGGGEKL